MAGCFKEAAEADKMEMDRTLVFESAAAIAMVMAGLYTYLVQPNFMDQTWGLSLALAIVLLIQSITRELETRYTVGAFFSVVFLGWNFIAGTGNRDFYIAALGLTYHGAVIRTTLTVLALNLLLYLKGREKDLKAMAFLILFFQIIGAVWAAKTF
ncbi:MAG: hypothetical protein D6733_05855 [Methanobacteriota archaeon]|nr:MAG: hypothetical protein D6733_05855 [Euryarchaeota archaeon]